MGRITFDEYGDATCTCGNTSHSDGFFTSVNGVEVEPNIGGPWVDEYTCGRCGASASFNA
jgi:hypothetical protein